ncbi:hypothetical protein DYH09_35025 [bacterium CPR1]|nr:hypothetical protein [bacterium CPR1]
MLKIVPVIRESQVRRFMDLSWRVHSDPATLWVPPVWMHLRQLMGRLRDPERRFLLALKDGEPVARVGVKIHGDALHFGFMECVQGHGQALARLLEEAHQLAPQLPMRGPYHFRLEEPYSGLLVEGFEHEPYFLMPYNPAYYLEYLEQAGMHKLKDLYAHEILPDSARLEVARKAAQRAEQCGVEVRTLKRSRLPQDVRSMAEVFDSALSGNWGFEPIDEEQVQALLLLTRYFLDPKLVWLASYEGRDVGSLFMLPNYNPLIKAARGRLTPGFVLRFLWGRKSIDSFRGYALGVRRDLGADLSGAMVAGALANAVLSEGVRVKWRALEVSWVLEDNQPMNSLARVLGGRRYKVYRVLEKPALR